MIAAIVGWAAAGFCAYMWYKATKRIRLLRDALERLDNRNAALQRTMKAAGNVLFPDEVH